LHVLHSLLDLAEAMCQFLLAKLDLFHLAFQYFGKVNMVFESAVDFLLELSHIQLEVSLGLFHSHFENRAQSCTLVLEIQEKELVFGKLAIYLD